MRSDNSNSYLIDQLEDMYYHIKGVHKDQNSTLNSPTYDSLDYGEKLIVNHNKLKDLIQIVDDKIAAQQCKKSNVSRSKSQQVVEVKKQAKFESKYQTVNLQQKMLAVREKLKEIIEYINEDGRAQKKNSKKEIQLFGNKESEERNQLQQSLQYSKDEFQLLEASKSKKITIDRAKLENAKETISHQFLHPDSRSKLEEKEPPSYMKSSLQKISEVQSGQNMTEKQIERSKTHSKKNSREVALQTAKNSLLLQEEINNLDDETSKIIQSAINKNKVSMTMKQKSGEISPASQTAVQERNSLQKIQSAGVAVRKSPFWVKNKTNFQNYLSKNTVVSHQSLEDSKVTEQVDKNRHNQAVLNPSLSKYSGNMQNKSRENTPQKAFPISKVQIISNQPSLNKMSQILSSQMITVDYPAQPQSQNLGNQVYMQASMPPQLVQIYSKQQRLPSAHQIKESKIIHAYRNDVPNNQVRRSVSQNRLMPNQGINVQPVNAYAYNPEQIYSSNNVISPSTRLQSPYFRSSSQNKYPQIIRVPLNVQNQKLAAASYQYIVPKHSQSQFVYGPLTPNKGPSLMKSPIAGRKYNFAEKRVFTEHGQQINSFGLKSPINLPPKPKKMIEITFKAAQHSQHQETDPNSFKQPSLSPILQTSQRSLEQSLTRSLAEANSLRSCRVPFDLGYGNYNIQSRSSSKGRKKGIRLTSPVG